MLKSIALIVLVAVVGANAAEFITKENEGQVPCKGRTEWCMETSNCMGDIVDDLCPHGNNFKCCVPKEATPFMRVTLIKARVKNVDGNVGLTPYDPTKHDYKVWSKLMGATDPEIVIRVGAKSDVLEKRTSDWKSNTLNPTYLEQYAFGRQGADAEMSWQIYDKNINPLDGLNTIGKRNRIGEGRVNLGKFRGTDAIHTFITDDDTNQSITLRISWSNETGEGCPDKAEHPRGLTFWNRDETICECTEKYHNLGESGQCEPYPAWVHTCGTIGHKYCKSKSNRNGKLRCRDYSWKNLNKKCPDGADGAACAFFSCKRQGN